MLKNVYLLIILTIIFNLPTQAQYGLIKGNVTNDANEILELVNVSVKGRPLGTSTDLSGNYKLYIPSNQYVTITFSSIGYLILDTLINIQPNSELTLNINLIPTSEQIAEVFVEDQEVRKSTLTRLDPKIMSSLPEASGNLEAIIKTLPGVSSNNELSSQYSVRGGNFDENLVYVNGIQVYRPFLVRSGQQEGMSFINPEMVSSVLFSAGGFEAAYGDKMSSVLDIKYRKPYGWGSSVTASLLGASLTLWGDSKNHRFRHISGLRYKTTKYLLNTLETEGEYDPKFLDFQTYMSYDVTEKLEVSFLGNYANNNYKFVPESQKTSFGTYNIPLELVLAFEGQEIDEFETYTGAFDFKYKVNDQTKLNLIGSSFTTNERETFDILSEYWINEIDKQQGSDTYGDSIGSLGIGSYLKHARNSLNATVYTIEHKGESKVGNNYLNWGASAQNEQINDNLNEWKMIDSAGYSIPYDGTTVGMNFHIHAKNNLNSMRYGAFVQNTYTFNFDSTELLLTAGVRVAYWDLNEEFLASPRVNLAFVPNWKRDVIFRLSGGYYYQPAFYKELRDPDDGTINKDIKSQKSIHFVLGSDYNFTAWGRPFKLVTEAYYKILKDLITYDVDNVRILYAGENNSDGYAMGVDFKLNGEFVKGVDSWISLSFMKTEEDIRGDMEPVYDDDDNIIGYKDPGYLPRPTDQRVNFSMFFQDYLPGNPSFKVHTQLNFASGLPYGPPDEPHYKMLGRTKSYQRIDIGLSKVLKSEGKTYPKGHFLYHVKEAWISFEVFNLLDIKNTISYEWVQDYSGNKYPVANTMTGRRLNLKLTAKF